MARGQYALRALEVRLKRRQGPLVGPINPPVNRGDIRLIGKRVERILLPEEAGAPEGQLRRREALRVRQQINVERLTIGAIVCFPYNLKRPTPAIARAISSFEIAKVFALAIQLLEVVVIRTRLSHKLQITRSR